MQDKGAAQNLRKGLAAPAGAGVQAWGSGECRPEHHLGRARPSLPFPLTHT